MHPCTDEEFARFYEPEVKSRKKVKRIQEQSGFYCVNWEEIDFELQGYWQSGQEYVGLDIVAAPCGHSYQIYNGTQIEPRDDCNYDQQAAANYLGTGFQFQILYNAGSC